MNEPTIRKVEPQVLSPARQAGWRLRAHGRYGHAAGDFLIPLTLKEFRVAARGQPIVFMAKDPVPALVMGLAPGENLMVGRDGAWSPGAYLPLRCRHHPFVSISDTNGGRHLGAVPASDLWHDAPGDPIFVNGAPSEIIQRAVRFLAQIEDDMAEARRFAAAVDAAGLIGGIEVKLDDGRVLRLRALDAGRLAVLDADTLAEWHRRGWLAAAFAMAASVDNWEGLRSLARRRAAENAVGPARDQVVVVEGFIPPALCRRILERLPLEGATALSLLDAATADNARDMARFVDTSIRHTLTVDIKPVENEVNGLFERLVRDVVTPRLGFAIDWWEYPQLLSYPPGGHYKVHTDGEYQYPDGWRRIADRDVSAILYLDDAFTGGELIFPDLEVTVRPKPGMAVVFPADRRFRHGAQPVLSGRRNALVTWMAAVGTARVVPWPPSFRYIRPGTFPMC